MHDHHEEDELDFPIEEGATTLSYAIGFQVLWNKADIELQMLKPASQPSQPSSSPPGDAYCSVVFHDMHRMLRRKDLDIAQVTLFAM
jgi:hypothetical protein